MITNKKIYNQKGVSLIMTFFTAFYLFFVRRVRAINNVRDFNVYNPEKGVSLIITFFIMIIILAVVLSISVLLYSEVRVIRNMGDSIGAYYSAESGVEKVLYYDRQIIPKGTPRGLCTMLVSTYADYCQESPIDKSNESIEYSLFCDHPNPTYKEGSQNGCNPSVCNDCTIYFDTTFDGRTSKVFGTIKPDGSFSIDSGGSFGASSRKIQIEMEAPLPPPME